MSEPHALQSEHRCVEFDHFPARGWVASCACGQDFDAQTIAGGGQKYAEHYAQAALGRKS